jgi:serine/threonine protein kinase/Flp pilus assembly protein TadD
LENYGMSLPEHNPKDIFAEALRLTNTAERQAYLDRACAGNLALCQEVESLLSAYEQAGDFFDHTIQLPEPDVALERLGTMIGRYKLLQKIGEGGFGVVYMAEQVEPVQRKVALKIIKAGMDSKEVIARFDAERQALALMDHPGIANILDGGATEAGRPYFVMELVNGIPITDYCDRKKLPTAERLQLFMKVCHAVQHAHQKGIIHRDLKPSNVLVTLHDGEPVPKVIDFGVVKALGQKLTQKTLFTGFQHLVGTPAYMSPEQAELSGLDVDTRSDIYSLGVLLYELLTGMTPFDKETLAKAAFDEMRRMIRETEPPKPSNRLNTLSQDALGTVAAKRQAEPTKLNRLVRGDLDWIVMKCLEKDRARRYETANNVAADIEHHLNNEPVVARPPSRLYRFQKLVRRNKLAFAATGAVFAALIIGLGVSAWMFSKEKRARQIAVDARVSARLEATKSRQVARFLEDMLEGVGPSVALGRDTKMLREILDRTAERVGKDLTDQPLVEAELRHTLGEVYQALGDHEKAEAMFRQALKIRLRQVGSEHLDTAQSLNSLAKLLGGHAITGNGRLPEAEALHREALATRIKLLGKEHPDVASSLNDLSLVLARQGKLGQAEAANLEALVIRKKLFGENHPEVVASLQNRTLLLIRQASPPHGIALQTKLSEAELCARNALVTCTNTFGGEHPETAASLHNLAQVLREQGRWADAEMMYRDALAMRRRLLSNTHPDVAETLSNLGLVLRQRHKYVEAEAMHREALANWRKEYGNRPFEVAYFLGWLMDVLRDQGKLTEIEALSREAVEAFEKSARENPQRMDYGIALGNSRWRLAEVLAATDRRAQAERIAREALQAFQQAARDFPSEPFLRQEQAFSHRLIGDVVSALGRVDEAVRHYRASIDLYGALARDDPKGAFYRQEEGYSTWMLAGVLERGGRLDAAEAECRHAIALHEKATADFPQEVVFTERLGTIKVHLVELLHRRGRLTEAKAMYREVAERGGAPELNELAWFLATCPDSNSRDGTNALTFAEKAVAATKRKNPAYLDTLAAAFAEAGQFAKAISTQQEAIALLQNEQQKKDYASRLKLYESGIPYRNPALLAQQSTALLAKGKFDEAEPLARECLAIREKQNSDDWLTFNARSLLGGSLLGQKKHAEAEPLLLAAYEGMKQREARIPANGRPRLKETLQRLVQLYDATDRPDQAAEWKQKLAEFTKAESERLPGEPPR